MSAKDFTQSQYLMTMIDTHHFAINVSYIEDVIKTRKKTSVPLSMDNINGLLNLRGHIVPEINVAKTLKISDISQNQADNQDQYIIVIMVAGDLYSLAFDKIGDVIEIEKNKIEPIPDTVSKNWHDVSQGVFRHDDHLISLLDVKLFIEKILLSFKDKMSSAA